MPETGMATAKQLAEMTGMPRRVFEDAPLAGTEDDFQQRLIAAKHLIRKSRAKTMRPMLPLLLNLKGKPYTLRDYFAFEPFFRTRIPRKLLLKTARQCSKTTSLAARSIITANTVPYFTILIVAPQFEMIRRFSSNVMRPFLVNSPVSSLFYDTSTTTNSVLQRTFKNESQIMFSYAYLSADRVRGVSSNQCVLDEAQDLDPAHLPIIRETMSGSSMGDIEQYAGTPKTLDNTIEMLWSDSSQAEWLTKCRRCGHWNIPCLTHDLDAMIGDWHPDISDKRPGVVCAKCRKPINPREGHWVHAFPDRRWDFAAYHVPQIIMPMHYADPDKWNTLLRKKAGKSNTPTNVFYNEVCGESYDQGARLVSVTDLKRAATLPWNNTVDEAKQHLNEYLYRVLAVDWGGGGEEEVSWTTLAVVGMLPNGELHVIYGFRSLTPHDHPYEAKIILSVIQHFHCNVMAHDYTGAGALRETFVNQAGFPTDRIAPLVMRGATQSNIIQWKPAGNLNPRGTYLVDKSRALLLTCNQIRNGNLRFFQDDYKDSEDQGLIRDFVSLVEDKTETRVGRDLYRIIASDGRTDDFAQAVMMGSLTLWHMTGNWPNIAGTEHMRINEDVQRAVQPLGSVDWEDGPMPRPLG